MLHSLANMPFECNIFHWISFQYAGLSGTVTITLDGENKNGFSKIVN